MRPIVALLYVLTFTAGLVDAVTILGLGDIFASLMTGNVVFIGLALGGAEDPNPWRSLLAIVAFPAGAAASGWIAAIFVNRTMRSWLLTIAIIEAALLLFAAYLGSRYIPQGFQDMMDLPVLAAVAATSFAMGTRNATVGRLPVAELKTTVLTLALTGLGADATSGRQQHVARRIGSVLLLGAGAASGAIMYLASGVAFPLVVTAAVVLGSTLVFAISREGKTMASKLEKA